MENLDGRLGLAFSLYDRCDTGADIGTDHAYLPIALLKAGKCRRMILTDISEGALENAREHIARAGLTDRVRFRLGDGLGALDAPAGMISILGMGGKTIRNILEEGRERLGGAPLILSAHTDLPHVRRGVMNIGYHLVSEDPCLAAGRYYLVMRAEPGEEDMTEREIRLGRALYRSESPALAGWLDHRLKVLEAKKKGLLSAEHADREELARTEEDLAFYRKKVK